MTSTELHAKDERCALFGCVDTAVFGSTTSAASSPHSALAAAATAATAARHARHAAEGATLPVEELTKAQRSFPDNTIATAKYTWWSYLPRSLFEQCV